MISASSPSDRTKSLAGQKRIAWVAALLILGLAVAGCSGSGQDPAATSVSGTNPATLSAGSSARADILADQGLGGRTAVQIIDHLDALPLSQRPSGLIASVQPQVLVLTDEQKREVTLELPQDRVYISVAPYRDQTHGCHFHSLTTCVGELAETEMQVTLTNDANGEVLVNGARTTYHNGFMGFWLPRGITATLTVELDGQIGTETISTVNDDDPTCITTLQLA